MQEKRESGGLRVLSSRVGGVSTMSVGRIGVVEGREEMENLGYGKDKVFTKEEDPERSKCGYRMASNQEGDRMMLEGRDSQVGECLVIGSQYPPVNDGRESIHATVVCSPLQDCTNSGSQTDHVAEVYPRQSTKR